ncbi:hypothetical protein Bbelb_433400 [Branchiostoma belcheri]|nr:hypothetical protein Bbelb_433400 [Branchiostoma belcheri]
MIEAITGSDTRTQVTFNPMTISPADRRSITLVGVTQLPAVGGGRGAALPAVGGGGGRLYLPWEGGGGRLYLPWEGGGFTCRGRGAALPAVGGGRLYLPEVGSSVPSPPTSPPPPH